MSAPFGFPFTESDVRLLNLKLTGRNDRNRRGEPVGEAQVVIDMSTQSQVRREVALGGERLESTVIRCRSCCDKFSA